MENLPIIIGYILRLIDILAWPIIVIYIVRIFYVQLKQVLENLAARIRSLHGFGIKAEFDKDLVTLRSLDAITEKELPVEKADQH